MKLAIMITLFVFISVSSFAEEHMHHHAAEAKFSPEFTKFMDAMNAGMEKMMKDMHSPGYTGNPDVDFLAMMIPHHEGAIEMARLILIYGTDPLVRKLAEDIIATQRVEIETMKQRLMMLRKKPDPDPGGFPAIEGTRGGK
ncbi:MAG: DUF305 domain-containing protein [Thermodesulfovibrionales bacterium]